MVDLAFHSILLLNYVWHILYFIKEQEHYLIMR